MVVKSQVQEYVDSGTRRRSCLVMSIAVAVVLGGGCVNKTRSPSWAPSGVGWKLHGQGFISSSSSSDGAATTYTIEDHTLEPTDSSARTQISSTPIGLRVGTNVRDYDFGSSVRSSDDQHEAAQPGPTPREPEVTDPASPEDSEGNGENSEDMQQEEAGQ